MRENQTTVELDADLKETDELACEVAGSPGHGDVPDDVCQDTDQAHQQVYKHIQLQYIE